MPHNAHEHLPDADLPRVIATTAGKVRWSERLDRSRRFSAILVVLSAIIVGFLVGPDWMTHSTYPTNEALIGTPARGDIKAHYDDRDDIIDDDTTHRLQQEAVARVPRVFDFDAMLGAQTQSLVVDTWAQAHKMLEARPTLSELSMLLREHLGITPSNAQVELLRSTGFPQDFALFFGRWVVALQSDPIIEDRKQLRKDAANGIIIRRISASTEQKTLRRSINDIEDLATVQRKAYKHLETFLASNPNPAMDASLRQTMLEMGRRLLKPTLTLNHRDSELERTEALKAVPPVKISIKAGQMIIRDGDMYTAQHMRILRHMAQYSHNQSNVIVVLGATLLVLILVLTGLTFGHWQGGVPMLRARDAAFLAVLFILVVVAGRVSLTVSKSLVESYPNIPLGGLMYLFPVAGGAMVVRLVLRLEAAIIFAVAMSVMIGLMSADKSLIHVHALIGGVLAATLLRSIKSRSDLLKVGLRVGLGQGITVLALQMFQAQVDPAAYMMSIGFAFAGGLLAGFIALGFTPVIEMTFRYSTDLELLELANLNHPALKELIVQAPGTYHHSIIVGTLVEAAAEKIGANALLAKVMAYYHDLGKGCNAMYFIENQRGGHNPHDKIKPSMSAMVIRRHITDGLEIAERHGLGEQIMAGIAEHHGTTLIQYFYARAKEHEDHDHPVQESDYRYPGRKPQSRETALVMLGDSVEAASRSLPEPTHARLRGLVNKVINTKFTDGQLDECDLTLRDLHTIAKAFMGVLTSIYHHRVEYPETKKKSEVEGNQNSNGHFDPKQTQETKIGDDAAEEDRPDNIRRLGLS